MPEPTLIQTKTELRKIIAQVKWDVARAVARMEMLRNETFICDDQHQVDKADPDHDWLESYEMAADAASSAAYRVSEFLIESELKLIEALRLVATLPEESA